jgi:hypothetical protein
VKIKAQLAACGLVLACCGSLLAQTQDKPIIRVASASYGLNVSEHALGNATKIVRSACDTKRSCNFAVKDAATALADPAPGQAKEFDVVYHCGKRVKKGHLNAESKDKILLLSCAD